MNFNRAEVYINMKNNIEKLSKEVEDIKLLKSYEDSIKFSELISFIQEEISKFKISIEELNYPFLMFVIGSGNYGKSTVINVLLKRKVVETSDLPNTWKLDLFRLDKEEKMELVYANNTKRTYKLNRGNNILIKEEKRYLDSKKKISELLREYKEKKYTKDELVKLKKQLKNQYIYKSEIVEVQYYLNNINILKDFIIVDTPGLNQKLLDKTKNAIEYYYSRADGIIWLIDAQNIISKKNKDLIKELDDLGNMYNQNKNIIGVVNKMDIIAEQGYEYVEKVKSKAIEIYKPYFDDIVFISAKQGLNGFINYNNKDIKESNINTLCTSIDNFFKIKSEEKQIKSKITNIYIMKNNISKAIQSYRRELYSDISKYNESKYELKNKTETLKKSILKNINIIDTNYWVDETSDIKLIIEDITSIEQSCNNSLNKIFNSLMITSNISNKETLDNISIDISFDKSKKLILDSVTNQRTNQINQRLNQNKKTLPFINSKSYSYSNNNTKINIKNNVDIAIIEMIKELEDKIYIISNEIDSIRESSFKEYHLSYHKYKEFIDKIEIVENLLNNMG